MKKLVLLIILFSQLLIAAWAQQAFVVRNIKVVGLQRVSEETVESYLPIKRGQVLRPSKTAEVVRALYRTGFFETISLSKENQTLIIYVTERPTIGQLKISGNSVIPTDKLTAVMKSMDVAEGRIYNPAIIERITQGLLNQYYQLGRYNARVVVRTGSMPRNRVMVQIEISEGLVAKIKRISIIGNHVFTEKTLLKQLSITTSGIFTLITQTDRYSEPRLEESLEQLRSFYLDHGYLHFNIKSSQAEITPDRKAVYITIVVDEGEQYRIEHYNLEGELIFPREEYVKRISVVPGDVFSRRKIFESEKAITRFLGDKGYLFATVNLRPEVNDQTHRVILIFEVKPGKRAYVRHITFSDNTRTNDIVLRREIQQMEAAPVSLTKLEDSKHRLSLLPYIKDVNMSLNPVVETVDQVDINYKVKEESAAQASFKIGYSQAYGMILGAGFNQNNFLGTGNTFGINLNHSQYEQYYGVNYTNPYYTEDGISRTINFSVSKIDPSAIQNLNNGYAMDLYNFGVLYGIPVGQEEGVYSRIMAGVNYQNIIIHLDGKNPGRVSNQVNSFVNAHGRHFQELDFQLGYSRNSYDRAIFPTRGTLQTLFLDAYAPLTSRSLSFYTLNYHGKWYQPLADQFIFTSRADFGYGNSFSGGARNFPFFKNFYAGGIDSVRGYENYSLGPRDSNNQAYGGNILVDASLGIIFPNYLTENLRTTLFVDAGNVYSSINNRQFGCNNGSPQACSTNSGPIRYSVGVEADWITPFGPISISLAQPLNLRVPPDKSQAFQFALGANF